MTGYKYITQRRQALGITQRELASRLRRIDGDGSISPQMMNCIEHGRRSYEPYVKDLSTALMVDPWVLHFYLGQIPSYFIDGLTVDDATIVNAYEAFNYVIRHNSEADS
jgi:transcriptional regulator with XRE-family HTH domain